MKPNQKWRICYTLISHWLRFLGYVGFEFTLQITFGAISVYFLALLLCPGVNMGAQGISTTETRGKQTSLTNWETKLFGSLNQWFSSAQGGIQDFDQGAFRVLTPGGTEPKIC